VKGWLQRWIDGLVGPVDLDRVLAHLVETVAGDPCLHGACGCAARSDPPAAAAA
jgi:hypothetical protein